jgi:hypothetical protein
MSQLSEQTFSIEGQTLRVGSRRYPAKDIDIIDNLIQTDARSFKTRRCRVPLENRWELSVVWGTATYSDNYYHIMSPISGGAGFVEEPESVEVAIFHVSDGVEHMCGEPEGYVDVETFHALVDWAMKLPSSGHQGRCLGWPQRRADA